MEHQDRVPGCSPGRVQDRGAGEVRRRVPAGRFGPRGQALLDLVNSLLGLLLFAAVAWYVARYGRVLQATGSRSETLQAVVYPWVYVVAAGGAGLALALLVDLLRALARLRPGNGPA